MYICLALNRTDGQMKEMRNQLHDQHLDFQILFTSGQIHMQYPPSYIYLFMVYNQRLDTNADLPAECGSLHAEKRTIQPFRCMACSLTRNQTMCPWLLKVTVATISKAQITYWHKECSGARRNVLKLVNPLSLCHLFVIFTHTALPAAGLTALCSIT